MTVVIIDILIQHSVSKQWRPSVLWRQIWVCTVFLCPTNRTLGLYGLRDVTYCVHCQEGGEKVDLILLTTRFSRLAEQLLA